MNEAETCRKLVRPRIEGAGWDASRQHYYSEQFAFTDGRIVTPSGQPVRLKRKIADFLLHYTRDLTLGVVEAKSKDLPAGNGLQQAKEYAEILGLMFAYATNGNEIIEYDYFSSIEREVERFPSPAELWERYQSGRKLGPNASAAMLLPYYNQPGREPRYYQKIAITRAVEAIIGGKRKNLLTMATGTGKTQTAFQICWKLWSGGWNARNENGRQPRMLFLADRNILIDDPMSKDFRPFDDARWKISGEANKSRQMYFATYQAIAADDQRSGLYREYAPDFFDLIVIDECHRGSSREESSWREILVYFDRAYQLGMTATPLREDNRDTYDYFGESLYTYSLRQGIDDGFLAPYRVHRILTSVDAAGWRPNRGQKDKNQRVIPDGEYHTKDFERVISHRGRTEAIARHLTEHLRRTDRYHKTIVFCVDQEHADQMRQALHNLNRDLAREAESENRTYVARVTSDEGDIGRGHLGLFQDPEERFPVILTTSQLLTTGVDAPTCRNIALVRVVGSMSEFKQIIGRGTRVREDKGKLFFHILDYTGSATEKFADPEFDGDPVKVTTEVLDPDEPEDEETPPMDDEGDETGEDTGGGDDDPEPRKFYIHGGPVGIDTDVTMDLDASGKKLRTVEIRQFAGDAVRTMCPNSDELRKRWSDADQRAAVLKGLTEAGIDPEELPQLAGNPEADVFDLLSHFAFDTPMQTRRERAERLSNQQKDFFADYGPEAVEVLNLLIEKYADHGIGQFKIPDILEVPPLSHLGNLVEIAARFGGVGRFMGAIETLQTLLYKS